MPSPHSPSSSTCWIVVAFALASAGPAFGHGSVDRKIREITFRIAEEPHDPALLLARAELHREHGDWPAARADLKRARELAPDLAAADLHAGRLELDAGRPAEAAALLSRFLSVDGENARARVLRARALEQQGRFLSAAADHAAAIASAERPAPDLFLERARCLASAGAGHLPAAIATLDAAREQLGPVVSLEAAAADFEVRAGRHAAAAERLEGIASRAARPARWHALRGDVLAAAGRTVEARAAYGAALGSIAALPARHRARADVTERAAAVLRALEALPAAPALGEVAP